MYTKKTVPQSGILERGYNVLGILRAAGYEAYVVGGILRTLMYGGETKDLDIAVVCPTPQELENLKKDLNLFYRCNKFELQHESSYDATGTYLADWRGHGDVNIIAYRAQSIQDVLSDFDYSFNTFYSNGPLHIDNPFGNGNPVVVLRKDCKKRDEDRYKRFREMYPHLIWE